MKHIYAWSKKENYSHNRKNFQVQEEGERVKASGLQTEKKEFLILLYFVQLK